jgi:hypothetical protein
MNASLKNWYDEQTDNRPSKRYAERGSVYRSRMPHSEVCCHLKVAGKLMDWMLQGRMVQLLSEDLHPFSFPILAGEAGVFEDGNGLYFYEDI